MSPGDRPDLPLTGEPAIVLRAATVGQLAPGPVQPVDHELDLEEEPAVRFEVLGSPGDLERPGATTGRDRTSRTDTTAPSDQALPTTGPRLPVLAALGSMGLAWVLRRRASRRPGTDRSRAA